LGGLWFKANQGKKLASLYLNKKAKSVVHIYNPSLARGIGRRVRVQGGPRQKAEVWHKW
jgi:hypothetical protein